MEHSGAEASCLGRNVGEARDNHVHVSVTRPEHSRWSTFVEDSQWLSSITQIYEGTNQVQRVVVAKHLLK